MEIQELRLANFRNYSKAKWNFDKKTIILGENGTGKTNILEAIYMAATGKSYRAGKEEEMIKQAEEVSVINYQLLVSQQMMNMQIALTDGSGMGRKKFEVNGIPRRMMDAVGKFRAVWFGPEDIEIITGSPSHRRKYLDFVLVQKDREYRRCLVSYEKGLRQRNRILENIREGLASRNQLFFWDKLLIKDGNYLTTRREDYLSNLGTSPALRAPSPHIGEGTKYKILYDKSIISETRIKQYETEEVAAASTLVGPHRDDFWVEKEGNNIAKFGSRGEQRMAVLWLKLGERDYLSEIPPTSHEASLGARELPVLLLDDVFSELDHKHRDEVVNLMEDQINKYGQVIMTTADQHMMPGENWKVIQLP